MRGMVDVCTGKMKLTDVDREIAHYMLTYSPTRLTVDIRRRKDGYHVTVYIPKKDFLKKTGN